MNRYSKIEYPNESSGGGGSNFSLPSFTNALGQTMSNMRAMQDFNEKMIDRQVQGLEEAGKLQTGLFSAIGGLNTYLSQYEGDKEYVDNIVKQYYTQLEDISKNPNDPYMKLKISDLGRKITADMTMGDLSKVISNAKIHAERTKDLESNKDVLKIDSGASADYDIQNKNFKGTFSRDKDGKISYNSLKYAPVAPALDIDTELAKYMTSVKPSTIPNDNPIEYATIEGSGGLGVIKINKTKGVNEATAFKNVKDYFMGQVNDPTNELRRRLVRDFNLKADGKDYVEEKDPSGKKIKLSLEEYLDLQINNLAHLKKRRFVNTEEDSTSQVVDQLKRNQEADEASRKAVLDSLRAKDIQHGMYDRDRKFNADRKDQQFEEELKLAELLQKQQKLEFEIGGRGKSPGGIGFNAIQPENSKETLLGDDQVEKKSGIKMLTRDALKDIALPNSHLNSEYKAVADRYDEFIWNSKKVADYAPSANLIKLNVDDKTKRTIAREYALLMSDKNFRESNSDRKADILRKKVEEVGATLPAVKWLPHSRGYSKPTEPMLDVIKQLESDKLYSIKGYMVTADQMYRGFLQDKLNIGVHTPAYHLSEDNPKMTSYFKQIADRIMVNEGLTENGRKISVSRDLNLSNDDFAKLLTDTRTKFIPNAETGKTIIKMQIPVKKDKETTYEDKVFVLDNSSLTKELGVKLGKEMYEAQKKLDKGDPAQLRNVVDSALLTPQELANKKEFSNKNSTFMFNLSPTKQVQFTPTTSTTLNPESLKKLKEILKVELTGNIVTITDSETGEPIGGYMYTNNADKESKLNMAIYNYRKELLDK